MDEVLQDAGSGESGHTTGRRSGRSQRIEIITRGERRRSWTLEQKREIVAESFGPELTPTEVARKHAISSGQLYTWRRQLVDLSSAVAARARPRFAEVELAPKVPGGSAAPMIDEHVPPTPPMPTRPGGMIEVTLANGVSLRVDAQVDGRALRRVLDALDRR